MWSSGTLPTNWWGQLNRVVLAHQGRSGLETDQLKVGARPVCSQASVSDIPGKDEAICSSNCSKPFPAKPSDGKSKEQRLREDRRAIWLSSYMTSFRGQLSWLQVPVKPSGGKSSYWERIEELSGYRLI